jgi:hypothetical protein
MASLRGVDHEVTLPDRCLVGRSRSCDLVLAARDVSGEHAVLQWCGTHWELRDLGSRNGTHVGEVRLPAGARVPLVAGVEIRFGRESPPWIFGDASAPQLMAVALADGARRVADGGYLALPGAEAPTLVVYQAGDGWTLERDGALEAAVDRAVVDTGAGGLWRIHLPAAAAGTWEDGAGAVVAQLRLRFVVSRDEEEVELIAWAGERRIDLQVRAHHYPLLLLARRRLADAHAGLAIEEQGWLRQDDLRVMLRMGEDHLGICIHRARAQLGKAGIADAAALVERRPGTRLLRLGVAALEVVTP